MDRVVKPLVMVLTGLGLLVAFAYLIYPRVVHDHRLEFIAIQGLGWGSSCSPPSGSGPRAILRNGFDLQRISAAAAAGGSNWTYRVLTTGRPGAWNTRPPTHCSIGSAPSIRPRPTTGVPTTGSRGPMTTPETAPGPAR